MDKLTKACIVLSKYLKELVSAKIHVNSRGSSEMPIKALGTKQP